jgi:hypothetical protein
MQNIGREGATGVFFFTAKARHQLQLIKAETGIHQLFHPT